MDSPTARKLCNVWDAYLKTHMDRWEPSRLGDRDSAGWRGCPIRRRQIGKCPEKGGILGRQKQPGQLISNT